MINDQMDIHALINQIAAEEGVDATDVMRHLSALYPHTIESREITIAEKKRRLNIAVTLSHTLQQVMRDYKRIKNAAV